MLIPSRGGTSHLDLQRGENSRVKTKSLMHQYNQTTIVMEGLSHAESKSVPNFGLMLLLQQDLLMYWFKLTMLIGSLL